jgi:hypothetical protein
MDLFGRRDSYTYTNSIVTVPCILNYTSDMLFISFEQLLLIRQQL